MHKPTLLADLVDIRHQIRSDRDADRESIEQRDRDIGRALDTRRGKETTLLRQWIESIRQRQPLDQGHHASRAMQSMVTALWLLGFVMGWGLGRAVLHYDGSEPVNIISALMILVISQLLILVILVILLAGGLERIRAALSFINPATWVARLGARLQPRWRQVLDDLADGRGSPADQAFHRWTLVCLGQHFAVALNLGIIAVLLYLVAVTDLAFGWNTTLAVESDAVSRLFQTLAAPWQWLLPTAAPDAELVSASRYYRLQSALRPGPVAASELGTWWLFLLCCILVYGLLPRVLALVYSGIRQDRALLGAIRASAGAGQVLARMRSPLVSSHATEAEDGDEPAHGGVPLRRRQSARDLQSVVVEWSGASADADVLRSAGIAPLHFYPAGGHQSMGDDRALLDRIAAHRAGAVALVVRSWEPPMLDFTDFVHALRDHVTPDCMLLILLLPMQPRGGVRPDHLEGWETALYALNDAALYVEALP